MLSSERKMCIINQLEKEGIVHLKAICEQLDASESTIRRDFEELEIQGKLTRVHGGAIKVSLGSILNESKELTMNEKTQINTQAKRELCRHCASFIQDGDCIFIDGGTTFMYLLDYIKDKNVKVVTHNDLVRLKEKAVAELIVIGGNNLPNYQMNVGPIALETLAKFNFDSAFIGCAGMDTNEGCAYTAEMDSAQIKMLAIAKSIHTYLVVDYSKLDTKGFYNFAKIEAFDKVIMDDFPKGRKIPCNIKLIK